MLPLESLSTRNFQRLFWAFYKCVYGSIDLTLPTFCKCFQTIIKCILMFFSLFPSFPLSLDEKGKKGDKKNTLNFICSLSDSYISLFWLFSLPESKTAAQSLQCARLKSFWDVNCEGHFIKKNCDFVTTSIAEKSTNSSRPIDDVLFLFTNFSSQIFLHWEK